MRVLPPAKKHVSHRHRVRKLVLSAVLGVAGILALAWGWWQPAGHLSDGLSAASIYLGIAGLATGVIIALGAVEESAQKWVIVVTAVAIVSLMVLCRRF